MKEFISLGMKVLFEKKVLQMRETFSIAYGDYSSRNSLLIQLSEKACRGYGECVEINYYGIDLDLLIIQLRHVSPFLENMRIEHPFIFFEFLKSKNLHPFLMSALDCAYWDLFGKLEQKSFIDLNNIDTRKLVESTFTISIAGIEEQINKIENSKWTRFKVKQKGYHSRDLEKLLALEVPISLDANASFCPEDCSEMQENPINSKFLYVEQPLEIGNYSGLQRNKSVNWMADEDVQNISFLEGLTIHYQSINIKLMKCGGLSPALEMIKKAKNLGYRVMLGCMTESSVGISAACALGGLLDFADLDGANLIANDFAQGSYVENGILHLSDQPGLGISLK